MLQEKKTSVKLASCSEVSAPALENNWLFWIFWKIRKWEIDWENLVFIWRVKCENNLANFQLENRKLKWTIHLLLKLKIVWQKRFERSLQRNS